MITVLAALGLFGQIVAGLVVLAGVLGLGGLRRPLNALRRMLWGCELWLAFLVSALATGGSLFFSEVAHFVPCELCWFQRICTYRLSIGTLLLALANDHRAAATCSHSRSSAPASRLPPAGRKRRHQADAGLPAVGAGGCATRWINEFGFETVPTLALTGFALTFALLGFSALDAEGARGSDRKLSPPDVALMGVDG